MIEATGCEYKLNDAKNKPVLWSWLLYLMYLIMIRGNWKSLTRKSNNNYYYIIIIYIYKIEIIGILISFVLQETKNHKKNTL